ncbi:MAG: hypothetical protein COV66_07960 [Nitrospinae bacterium CG11_big_fil_rev_8_21_14_0_20_45_15]|nr:MAG: hypothetical protein COV66_07960 [Nitrospinae bacterium CG11_big_fil_rev_8_21_14_0_20_45_15]
MNEWLLFLLCLASFCLGFICSILLLDFLQSSQTRQKVKASQPEAPTKIEPKLHETCGDDGSDLQAYWLHHRN